MKNLICGWHNQKASTCQSLASWRLWCFCPWGSALCLRQLTNLAVEGSLVCQGVWGSYQQRLNMVSSDGAVTVVLATSSQISIQKYLPEAISGILCYICFLKEGAQLVQFQGFFLVLRFRGSGATNSVPSPWLSLWYKWISAVLYCWRDIFINLKLESFPKEICELSCHNATSL